MASRFIYFLSSILFFLLIHSCTNSRLSPYEDILPGQWFVQDIEGGYEITGNNYPETITYIQNLFYGDYLFCIKGDKITFASDGELGIDRIDNSYKDYIYDIHGSSLEIEAADYNTNLEIDGNNQNLSITFNENSLMDYIKFDIAHNKTYEQQQALYKIYNDLEYGIRNFRITYHLQREEPTMSQVVSGHFYGALYDGTHSLIYPSASTSIIPYRDMLSLQLNDPVRLSFNGPEIYINFQNLQIDYSKTEAGGYNFGGSYRIWDPYYGSIDFELQGRSHAGLVIDANIYIQCQKDIYQLSYTDGIRYLLPPLGERSIKSLKQEPAILQKCETVTPEIREKFNR